MAAKKKQTKKKETIKQDGITIKKADNFSDWYRQVITKSDFVDYTEVSGCIAFRPMAYAVWEIIVKETDKRLKSAGIQNAYFPMFIPERLLAKEAEHVEGFSPEVAWVTHTGDTKLDERLAVRPTSETIMYESFKKWIRSWRDLPLRLNQWNSVVRWEFKHPVPLLRSREFLWNEGHTVFATEKKAAAERDQILGIYEEITKDFLALPGIIGKKTDKEKFAGALASYSIEHLLPDGRAIQGPDFHSDGQNFAKAFDIKFVDRNEKMQYAWQNTFAISTRELGVMAAIHSDDKGLILPPKVAPVQVVIIPIFDTKTKKKVLAEANKIEKATASSFRVQVDDRDGYSPGWKFNDWELKGVPLRIEIGPKDIEAKQVVFVRRDTGKKEPVKISKLKDEVPKALEDIQKSLYNKAKKHLDDNTHKVKTLAEFKKAIEKGGFVQSYWCGARECEDKIKDDTGAKITNIPFNQGKITGDCLCCGKKGKMIVNFARSY